MAIQPDPVQQQRQKRQPGCFCHQKKIEKIDLLTPRGILLHLMPLDVCFDEQQASCAIRKDGGDDPDATDGLLVYAVVSNAEKQKRSRFLLTAEKVSGGSQSRGLSSRSERQRLTVFPER